MASSPNARIRVLIVDDSAAMRQLLKAILCTASDIDVIGVANDPFDARQKMKKLNPDVITLDVEMPLMDGLTFLDKLMRGRPTPVVMVSSLTQRGAETTLRALELGAVDFIAKPTLDTLRGVQDQAHDLVEKIRIAAKARVSPRTETAPIRPPAVGLAFTHQLLAIGASTGGTEAVREVISALPADAPGTVIVQHMPPGFTHSFAGRLDQHSAMSVKEAEDGDRVLPGHALVAPGGLQTEVIRSGAEYRVRVYAGERVSLHQPSVNVLFDSVAKNVGRNSLGVILTGMGSDGADGMLRMRQAGSRTCAQDEATSVVFGMPKEAIARGGVDTVLPLSEISRWVISNV